MVRRCDLCGAELPRGEWLAVRYACLTSCVPILQGQHLKSMHRSFYSIASKRAKLVTYTSGSLFLIAAFGLVTGFGIIAVSFFLGAMSILAMGTLYRSRLLKTHRCG
ncbi:MAG: hypothetical protein NZ957_02855 [Thaumarchaeota archaeon]|nr:hypothetical protein [Candidatus Calditenuaceae archaeon]MDW8042237.1 hypothetical protein [Nitrososphaerota archaeon]